MTYRSPKYREPAIPIGTVAELFAGVGGFRIGLARAGLSTVFSNQWEPSTKRQHASEVYVHRFGPDGHTNCDIAEIEKLPTSIDLLVGGFPCQDYSVAKTLNRSKGIRGKKGVLWWEILRLIQQHKPPFIFLENVDRLLSSPAKQRGRDFAVMLRCLSDVGYVVEWRIVNAAEYGMPQRRIRIYIIAYKRKTRLASKDPVNVILHSGILARALRVEASVAPISEVEISEDLYTLTKSFNKARSKSPFLNSGFYRDGIAYTCKTKPSYSGKKSTLGEILVSAREVPDEYHVEKARIKDWKFLKGSKSIERTHKDSGTKYNYSEGSMAFPDLLIKPSRTILTGEGGTSPSRFKHIIRTKNGYRRLTPKELERLNGFPDDWTLFDLSGGRVSDNRRAFFMGNALVIGIVEKIGKVIAAELKSMR
jgi:DNA (cytosine-5)-methyltransferase 1